MAMEDVDQSDRVCLAVLEVQSGWFIFKPKKGKETEIEPAYLLVTSIRHWQLGHRPTLVVNIACSVNTCFGDGCFKLHLKLCERNVNLYKI